MISNILGWATLRGEKRDYLTFHDDGMVVKHHFVPGYKGKMKSFHTLLSPAPRRDDPMIDKFLPNEWRVNR